MKFKKIMKLLVNLKLFDGEGEGQAAGTASIDPGNSSPGIGTGEQVVYGKGTDDTTASDDSSTAQEPDEGTKDTSFDFSKITPEQRTEVYKQFKENFKDEFSKDFQSHFDRRFKNHKEVETKISQYEPVIENLMKYHGVANFQELQELIDTSVLTELADKEGFSDVSKYKEYLEGQKAIKRDNDAKQAQLQQQQQDAKINEWVEQGRELQKTYPNFDLAEEAKNQAFIDKLERGYTVEEAYFLLHKNEILSTTAKKAEENLTTSIQSKAKRIPENGTKQAPGVVRKADPSKLSNKDLEEIAARAARGEKIRF
jgi:predicted DsbA family dithiol-disulfide isomerase